MAWAVKVVGSILYSLCIARALGLVFVLLLLLHGVGIIDVVYRKTYTTQLAQRY